jgi:hypothetical protein
MRLRCIAEGAVQRFGWYAWRILDFVRWLRARLQLGGSIGGEF